MAGDELVVFFVRITLRIDPVDKRRGADDALAATAVSRGLGVCGGRRVLCRPSRETTRGG